jgi:nucleoside-diphosphate-sugar epimerase
LESAERKIENVTVAVAGACGFYGSHLVEHLIEDRNCEVIALDNLLTGQKKFLHSKAKFIWCDITQSENRLYKILKENKVDYVINCVAEPYVPISFERPLHVFDTNARGALMLINASQEAGVKGILQISSAEIYGDIEGKINEEAKTNPHSSYGASKLAIDTLVQARWHEAKTPCIALRMFNLVGENETHPYVIPEIIRQVSTSNDIYLGSNTYRDFQYAGDAAKMAVELLEKGNFGEVYNMGSEKGIQIYELAMVIGRLMGKTIQVFHDVTRDRPKDINHLQSDNTKLYSVIDYRPKVSLEEALKRTIADYEKNGFCF